MWCCACRPYHSFWHDYGLQEHFWHCINIQFFVDRWIEKYTNSKCISMPYNYLFDWNRSRYCLKNGQISATTVLHFREILFFRICSLKVDVLSQKKTISVDLILMVDFFEQNSHEIRSWDFSSFKSLTNFVEFINFNLKPFEPKNVSKTGLSLQRLHALKIMTTIRTTIKLTRANAHTREKNQPTEKEYACVYIKKQYRLIFISNP